MSARADPRGARRAHTDRTDAAGWIRSAGCHVRVTPQSNSELTLAAAMTVRTHIVLPSVVRRSHKLRRVHVNTPTFMYKTRL